MSVKVKDLPVHIDNPFIEQLATEMEFKNKMSYASNKRLNVTNDNGDIISDALVAGVKQKVEANVFVKMYVNGFTTLFGLSPSASVVFSFILRVYGEQKYNNDRVYITHDELKYVGYDKTFATYRKGLSELISKDFLAQISRPKEHYFVNPNMFYKGNRLILVQEFIKETPQELIK